MIYFGIVTLSVISVIYISLPVLDRTRAIVYQIGIDTVEIVSRWSHMRMDVMTRQAKLKAEIETARLKIAEQRFKMLDKP